MTPPAAATRPQTAQLLNVLYQYVVSFTPSHSLLLPAVAALREAAQFYGRGDQEGAFQKGVGVYQFLVQARASNPDLPLP